MIFTSTKEAMFSFRLFVCLLAGLRKKNYLTDFRRIRWKCGVVRDLGVFIDNDLGTTTHVPTTVSRCFAALRQLRHLRRYVTDDCFRSFVGSLIHSRLDYGNFVPSWSGYRLIYSDVYNLCSTLRLIWFLDFVATTTSQTLSLLFTGCAAYTRAGRLQSCSHDVSSAAWSRTLDQLVRVADGRRRLRSSSSLQLHDYMTGRGR